MPYWPPCLPAPNGNAPAIGPWPAADPRCCGGRAQYGACDLTLRRYYGPPAADPQELYRGARKAGTKPLHAYATAYLMGTGCRYTVAVRCVQHADPWAAVVRDLLR